MKHAGSEALQELGPLLDRIRNMDGLVEKKLGVFYRKSQAFLHFHEDPTGMYADVRVGEDFDRVRATTRREQDALIAKVRRALK